jgi:aminopeptidase YwaD
MLEIENLFASKDTRVRQPLSVAALLAALAPLAPASASASAPPLLPSGQVAAIANELSGEAAKRNLEGLALFHRQRGSQGFHAAAELIAERARAYGLRDVEILRFAADGKIRYGTQRSRPAWDVEEAELSEIQNGRVARIASYAASPIVLAEDSESADVTAERVDVGEGSRESDYAGKDVKGRIVLAAQQPGAVAELAVGKFGAAGIVSYAQNQRTAWSGDDDGLVRCVYQDSSFRIPAIYMNDWPDRYIHTNRDGAANIDPTKLKRAAFIGAASGYFLANFSSRDLPAA